METKCPDCGNKLSEPYIKCCDCQDYLICPQCFSRGFESGTHSNDHRYTIITNDFPIMEVGWTAAEELKLLDALADCGPGNWNAIAAQVDSKDKKQCETHYMKFYVINAKYPFPEMPYTPVRPPCAPIQFKACEDPCRPLPDSHRAHHMAGYLAARGDFIEEYDNHAEWCVSDVYFSPDDKPILKALKLAVVKIYQSRLNERARRKHIIRKFGLINSSNHSLHYYRKLPLEIRELEEKLRPVMQLQKHPIAHDKMIQGLWEEFDLKKKINKLKAYRQNGIRSFRGVKMYDKLKKQREESKQHTNHMSEILPHLHDPVALAQWLQRQAVVEAGVVTSSAASSIIPVRKTIPPLDLSGLPGVEKLTAKEKEFCSKVRFVPEAFFKYKDVLINEFRKNSTVRLANARNIVKIDVNKTRKLYDFLIENGHIAQ